ncbi:hypothetical protein NL676_002338 [Syzygium grande]|nr:hypothetical protein NL676_002338 [Syzygium grande]
MRMEVGPTKRGLFDQVEAHTAATDLAEPPPTGRWWGATGPKSAPARLRMGEARRGVGGVAPRAGGASSLRRRRLMVQVGSSPPAANETRGRAYHTS